MKGYNLLFVMKSVNHIRKQTTDNIFTLLIPFLHSYFLNVWIFFLFFFFEFKDGRVELFIRLGNL